MDLNRAMFELERGSAASPMEEALQALASGLFVSNRSLLNGVWTSTPSIFRLQMTGTGTVTLDSKDALGNITLSVYTVSLTGATNEIGFPYAGDAAVYVRATLTGTATAKVI